MPFTAIKNVRTVGCIFLTETPVAYQDYQFAPGNEDLVNFHITKIVSNASRNVDETISFNGQLLNIVALADANCFTVTLKNSKGNILVNQYPVMSLLQRRADIATNPLNTKNVDGLDFDLRDIDFTQSIISCVAPTSLSTQIPFVIPFQIFYE